MNTNNNRSEVDENVIDLTHLLDQAEEPENPTLRGISYQALDEAIASGTLHLLDLDNAA